MDKSTTALEQITALRHQLDVLEKTIKQTSSVSLTLPPTTSQPLPENKNETKEESFSEKESSSPDKEGMMSMKELSESSDFRKLSLLLLIPAAIGCNLIMSAKAIKWPVERFVHSLPYLYENHAYALKIYLVEGSIVWLIPVIATLVSYFRKKDWVLTYITWQTCFIAIVLLPIIFLGK